MAALEAQQGHAQKRCLAPSPTRQPVAMMSFSYVYVSPLSAVSFLDFTSTALMCVLVLYVMPAWYARGSLNYPL